MLYKSKINLGSFLLFLVHEKPFTVFSAYLKLNTLKEVNRYSNITQIIVRWEVQDLCLGASDLEVYEYCKANDIILYRNPRLHLKAIWDNHRSVFFGSANITNRGIGEKGNFNYELNGEHHEMSLEDRMYLKNIINDSHIVDDKLYEELTFMVAKFKAEQEKITYPTIEPDSSANSKFLLSQLPMTIDPIELFQYYNSSESDLSEFESQCLVNDLCSYQVNRGLTRDRFLDELRKSFNGHPFICALKDQIKGSESLNYGSVVNWIKNNTTTVPTPRSWELKRDQIVNILYNWICFFDADFYWNRPNHSQIIFFKRSG